MSNRWQYLGHVEPVLPTPRVEPINLSMWEPHVQAPPRSNRLTAAILAGAFFFTPVYQPTIDKWEPKTAAPVRRVVLHPAHLSIPETPSPSHALGKWDFKVEGAAPQFQKRRPSGETVTPPFVPAAAAPVTLSWHADIGAGPRFPLFRPSGETFGPVFVPTPAAPVTLSWLPELDRPSSRPARVVSSAIVDPLRVVVAAPAVHLSWLPELAVPGFTRRHGSPGFTTAPFHIEAAAAPSGLSGFLTLLGAGS